MPRGKPFVGMEAIEASFRRKKTTEAMDTICAKLAEGRSIRKILARLEISRPCYRFWLKDDPEFAERVAEAEEIGLEDRNDLLEDEALRRAVEGVDKPVIFQGGLSYTRDAEGKKVPLTTKEYSDSLLDKLLQANMPDKYRNRVSTEVSGSVNVEIRKFGGGEVK